MLETIRDQFIYKEIQKACASDAFGEVSEDLPKQHITVYNPNSKDLKNLTKESVFKSKQLCKNNDMKTQY